MNDVTGYPTLHFSFPENRYNYYEIEDFTDNLWNKLSKAKKKGFIMCASTPGVDRYTEYGGANSDKGIVSGHAYSVISVKQNQDIRLLLVRNTWEEHGLTIQMNVHKNILMYSNQNSMKRMVPFGCAIKTFSSTLIQSQYKRLQTLTN